MGRINLVLTRANERYDASGNLATRLDANAKTTTYSYDAAPVNGVYQSTPAVEFKGRLTGVINSNS